MKKFLRKNINIIKYILTLFLLWQLAILGLEYITPKIIPAKTGKMFMYNDGKEIINPPFFWTRANFDGSHYLLIAKKGYGLYQQAFFPFYPSVIKFFTPFFGGKNLITAIVLSNTLFLISIFMLYKLILLDFKEKTAKTALMFLIVFPTSFFFGMAYTESLFLFLVIGCFLSARKEKWLLAGILAWMASATRIVGIFLFPALLLEAIKQANNDKKTLIKNIAFSLLSFGGILSYMQYLWKNYHDALLFFNVQPYFGAGRSNTKIILIYQVFYRYLKMILTTTGDPLYFAVWMELLCAVLFLLLLVFSYKKIRTSYLVFSFFAYITPTLTGTFSSMPRYCLILFPCFIYLANLKNSLIRKIIIAAFAVLFVVSCSFFLRGYWIS